MLRKLGLGTLTAAFLLLAIEAALRLFLPTERLLFEWERPTGLLAFTEGGALVTRPGMNEVRRDGPYPWRVALNELGLREDGDIPPEKPAGTFRILALGDSWIFGFSVSQGHTIADDLERILPERLGVDRVEVINAAIFGSCAFDMLRRYRQFADAWELDGVLLGQPHNGARQRVVAEERSRWYSAIPQGPRSRARLYLLTRRGIASLRAPRYAEPPGGNELAAEIGDLQSLAAEARERGHGAWFAELPNDLKMALHPGFTPSPAWREGMRAAGVPYGGHALDERSCWGFTDIGHPSEAGARVIAEVLAEVIATGTSLEEVRHTPECSEVAGAGPGKPGWEWTD